MTKKYISKKIGITINAFNYYSMKRIIDYCYDDFKNADEQTVFNLIDICKRQIAIHKSKPVKKPQLLKEDFNLPKMYREAEKIRDQFYLYSLG